MASAAPSPLASSVEKTNGAKLSRLLIDGGTTVLRKIFDGHHSPANLITDLNANYPILNNLLRRRVLNGHQWDKLFPPGGVAPDSKTFDITLLFLLLTNICGLTPPPSGWHTKPPSSDTSHEANLARVKFYRNVLHGHVTTTGVDTLTFSTMWTEISGVLVSLGLDQGEVDRLKAEKGGEQDYIDVLIEWADSEEDIKSHLKNINQCQSKTHQAVEYVREAQVKTQKTVKDIQQTQASTQKTVKDIHQTQASTQKTVEDIHQTQANTQKTVEDIHQTQASTQKTVEDIHQTQTSTQKTVKDIHQTQANTQKTVEDIHQTQTSTQMTVEGIHHTQANTQKTVEDIHQTQASTQKTVEDIHQTQASTRKKVEDLRHTQDKTQQSVEDVAASLNEMKETIVSLKQVIDKDRRDEVFRDLAKSEFRADIEYYVQRFQEGTREWVFDKVQKWLDDRSSQNRVMVISGNAGMGKSVIAAVICKRMQEAGRLSGSHFCQYNNVRYCKPQLLIQSLACHLSHTLPEYKHALGEQLSRNLGTDLNNMGVEELFALLFKEPLSAVVDPGRNMLIVIDGLDESEYKGRNELLDVIANQFCTLPIWIRFLVTTRPALNIAERLKYLKPCELKSDGEENLEDVRVFCLKRLEHIVKPANLSEFVERLVLKSEGLMLYAHFLILLITENASIFQEGNLVSSLPLGISSVYHSYFKRLEHELLTELDINEEHFLNLLSAITASRESLPVGFVSKALLQNTNSSLAFRKVLRALNSVSALLPVRDDCLHVIHKSVQDWLTDVSCYEAHEFIVDENVGNRILASLCIDELVNLKRKGVHNTQFSATERYALYHGAYHIFHEGAKREPHELDGLTKAFVTDLEIMYGKICVNSTLGAEGLVWLKKQGIYSLLSKDNQSILDTLLFLLRKFLYRFTDTPCMFLQTILNEGGKVLIVEASNLLQHKYREIPYMEVIRKEPQQGGVVARFLCSSVAICLDVSPQLDYLVCECEDGMLQLWSLHTGKLMWTRPVVVEKRLAGDKFSRVCRYLPSVYGVLLLFRSVVFHPTKECILPGILSQAYTMDGDFKPLFPGSNCRFSVCSISGDKTKILTNCLENSKCLVLWSLENGSEIDRVLEDENILSFAWSGDGRLVASSLSSGLISLVDLKSGFRKLTVTPFLCGMLKFSPDHQFLFCCNDDQDVFLGRFIWLGVVKETHNTFSLKHCSNPSYDFVTSKSFNDCGFSFGDLVRYTKDEFSDYVTFVLDEQRLLGIAPRAIAMHFDIFGRGISNEGADGISLSLDGETVYVGTYYSVSAWNTLSGNYKEINNCVTKFELLCPVRGGVLIATRRHTLEHWNNDLSKCMEKWALSFETIYKLIPVSKERVAVVRKSDVKVLDTSIGEFVSTITVLHGRVLTCNSKGQLLTSSTSHILELWDDTTVVWKNEGINMGYNQNATFSPMERFVVVVMARGVLVLDAETGSTLHTLLSWSCSSETRRGSPSRLTFISDDECAISHSDVTAQLPFNVNLFNVKSGELLSAIDVESHVTCLAACPFNRVLAIGLKNSTPNFKVIRVYLPLGKDRESGKRPCGAALRELDLSDLPHQSEQQSAADLGEARQAENKEELCAKLKTEKEGSTLSLSLQGKSFAVFN